MCGLQQNFLVHNKSCIIVLKFLLATINLLWGEIRLHLGHVILYGAPWVQSALR